MDNMYNNFGEVTETKVAFGALMRKVYLWMTLALAITGLTAAWVAQSGAIYQISQGWYYRTRALTRYLSLHAHLEDVIRHSRCHFCSLLHTQWRYDEFHLLSL